MPDPSNVPHAAALSDAFHQGLRASIERTLVTQARHNELIIGHVRAIALAAASVLDLLLYLQPPGFALPYAFSPLNSMLAASWLGFALILVWALRRGWYRPWLRLALPLADGCIMLSLFVCIFLTASATAHLLPAVANTGIACALLAVSGALRLYQAAAWLTTLLAMATFGTVATLAGSPAPETVFACALLAGVGCMGGWLNTIARRAVESEVGQLVLGRFLPRELVTEAHQQPLAVLAEPRRMEATVLVSDLRGFTGHAERMAPERLFAQLNRIQGVLATIVEQQGGRVDKFMGDGMLAVFAAVPAQPVHAARALQAAERMRGAVRELDAAMDFPVRLGLGIHSGPIVAGCLGSGLRLEFTVLGDTVNTAARLQDLTKELGVEALASAVTLDLARKDGVVVSHWQDLGPTAIRGRQAEVEVYGLGSRVASAA